jgi:hypothetical protein
MENMKNEANNTHIPYGTHSKLHTITLVATKVLLTLQSFVVNMDACYYRISVACDIIE